LSGVDAKFRENHIILHVKRTERLVVVVNQRDGILSGSHGRAMKQAMDAFGDKAEIIAVGRFL
jgi:hypothetical protein